MALKADKIFKLQRIKDLSDCVVCTICNLEEKKVLEVLEIVYIFHKRLTLITLGLNESNMDFPPKIPMMSLLYHHHLIVIRSIKQYCFNKRVFPRYYSTVALMLLGQKEETVPLILLFGPGNTRTKLFRSNKGTSLCHISAVLQRRKWFKEVLCFM